MTGTYGSRFHKVCLYAVGTLGITREPRWRRIREVYDWMAARYDWE